MEKKSTEHPFRIRGKKISFQENARNMCALQTLLVIVCFPFCMEHNLMVYASLNQVENCINCRCIFHESVVVGR